MLVNGLSIGRVGLLASEIARSFGLDETVAVAELELDDISNSYPPDTEAQCLPSLPAVERDVSAIVSEDTTWATLRGVIDGLQLEHVEAVDFVEIYRGSQIGAGRKSVTMRLRFRAPDRTLVSESVDVQVDALIGALAAELGAEIRR